MPTVLRRACTYERLFTELADLSCAPSAHLFRLLSRKYESVSGKPAHFEAWKQQNKFCNTRDLLSHAAQLGVRATLLEFLMRAPLIRQRTYSIASLNEKQNKVELFVRKVHLKEDRLGLQANQFARLQPNGQLSYYVRRPPDFSIDTLYDGTQNIMMISIGSGLAPFLFYLQKIQTMKAQGFKKGHVTVVYGCQSHDAHHQIKFLEAMHEQKVIDSLHLAFSREGKREHVQEIVENLKHNDKLFLQQLETRTLIFVCGNEELDNAFRTILSDYHEKVRYNA